MNDGNIIDWTENRMPVPTIPTKTLLIIFLVMQWVWLVLCLCFYLRVGHAQENCRLKGTFLCTGGSLIGVDFGRDDDDASFAYYAAYDNGSESSCAVLQVGVYHVEQQTITADFEINSEDCEVFGVSEHIKCSCVTHMKFAVTNNCTSVISPSGDVCEPLLRKSLAMASIILLILI